MMLKQNTGSDIVTCGYCGKKSQGHTHQHESLAHPVEDEINLCVVTHRQPSEGQRIFEGMRMLAMAGDDI
jgi:hypothetical protein